MKQLFGTDGIRGLANQYPMTALMAMKTGRAVALFVKQQDGKQKNKNQGNCKLQTRFTSIVIGKDTRISGDMLEAALSAGIASVGINVLLAGVIPTPGIAFLASQIKEAGAGIVISASHNPYYDNGIKIFNCSGYKLSDKEEDYLENLILNSDLNGNQGNFSASNENSGTFNTSRIDSSASDNNPITDKNDRNAKTDREFNIGSISVLTSAQEQYADFLKKQFKGKLFCNSLKLPREVSNDQHVIPLKTPQPAIAQSTDFQSVGLQATDSRLTDSQTIKSNSVQSRLIKSQPYKFQHTKSEQDRFKLIIDCSNGAAFQVAPLIFKEPAFDSEFIFNEPNGKNINDNCGSQHTEVLSKLVLKKRADMGLAFDGDADRLIALDERGDKITGDTILAICANHAKNQGKLKNNLIISTVMSNIGLSKALKALKINHLITDVGDREVLKKMKETGAIMGGEDSGHMIFSNCHTTGDGILTALKLISVMADTGQKLSELASVMTVYPQVLMNVAVVESKPDFMKIQEIADEIKNIENELKNKGRVLVRYSGTQPLLRVMVEGPDKRITQKYCERICRKIKLNPMMNPVIQ